jgi:small subunit ribosomal protein S5
LTQTYRNDRNSEETPDFQEHVVHIRRVAKVVKGGRHLTFNAMVVVGDGQGRLGAGLGKGGAVPDAVRKGNTIARSSLIPVALTGGTVPHAVVANFGASRVIIKPGKPGSGVKAGGAVRAVMEAAGVKDVVTKALGSRNPINLVKATMAGLQQMQGPLPESSAPPTPKAVLPALSAERRGPLRREGGGGFRGRDRDRRPPRPNGPGAPGGYAPSARPANAPPPQAAPGAPSAGPASAPPPQAAPGAPSAGPASAPPPPAEAGVPTAGPTSAPAPPAEPIMPSAPPAPTGEPPQVQDNG